MYPAAHDNLDVDLVVVGGGITGVTAAYLAKKSGKTVALFERERCGCGDTGHTTAHLTAFPDLSLDEIEKKFGEGAALAVWAAGCAAIDQIVANVRAEEIECDFRWVPGFLHAPRAAGGGRESDLEFLRREAEVAGKLGIEAEYVNRVPVFETPGVKFPNQALFHPLKYVDALLAKIAGDGSCVFENSPIDTIEEKDGDRIEVSARNAKIGCKDVFIATHTPLAGTAGLVSSLLFQTKLYLYSSYALSARLSAGTATGAFWDTSDPYFYLRIEEGDDESPLAIYGGEDHKTGQETNTHERFASLERAFLNIFPDALIESRWSGQVIETNDGLPYIGETAAHQYVATGFAGNGMTFGTLGAMMAVDYVHQRPNPWSELFSVERKKLRGGILDYMRENIDYPYYLVRQCITPAPSGSTDELAPGEGGIISLSGRKVAAYRGEDGKVTLCSPVCPHLKCIVEWNTAEKTWDCPCHGSRFKSTGEVISGPAEEDLAPFEELGAK